MGVLRSFSAIALGAALVLGAAPASAFCRSTTCTGGDCPRDDNGCKTTGNPLAWPGVCVGFSIQKDGTVNLPLEDVRAAIEQSFATWSDLDCGKGLATIAFSELEDASCHATEYNPGGPNANIILFQDYQWRYHGADDTLAKTTVTFDADTGTILDADIEVNHAYNEFTLGDDHVVYDLESVITHEIGHFLGLDHSPDFSATMYAGYEEGSLEQRSLEADDIEGLCTIYPPGRSGKCDTTPKGGFADACGQEHDDDGSGSKGCALSASAGTDATGMLLLTCGLFLHARRRRRTRG
ncbi:MAG: matrixin family metalloprotease [Minicystis sp.]